ncbi:hypothetical protein TthSNM76_11450 [Thermus thermophilus]|nr:hypothetical protein TthSNM76_11450 [Thermus thermophilus]
MGGPVVRVDVHGVPGDHGVRTELGHEPGQGQGLLPATGEEGVLEGQKAVLGPDEPRHVGPVPLPHPGHLLLRRIPELAGKLPPGHPDEHHPVPLLGVEGEGAGRPDLVVRVGKDRHEVHEGQSTPACPSAQNPLG